MSLFESTRPLYAVTEGEFYQNLEELIKKVIGSTGIASTETEPEATGKRYVYGLSGLMGLLGVSKKTAFNLKEGVLAPAVKQRGRKIIVDADLALKLFDEKKGRK